jgi:predicted Fe-Mo cluster-binding NifX family protein
MVNISRRVFLNFLLIAGFFGIPENISRKVGIMKFLPKIDFEILSIFLDVLIPDDITLGAVKLGVTEKIIHKAAKDKGYYTVLLSGCAWLNKQALKQEGISFSMLTSGQLQRIVQQASESSQNSMSHRFFTQTSNDAFYFYYSHPEAVKLLAYSGPPQPNGFPDYSDPPFSI